MSDNEREGASLTPLGLRLQQMANSVADSRTQMGRLTRLPLKERLAVALILDRRDLFVDGEFTILQAVEFLGDEWVRTALAVQTARASNAA